MSEERVKVLETSIRKFLVRGAKQNIRRLLIKTHIADIAAVLDHLPLDERVEVLNLEPSAEKRAGIITYLNKEHQTEVLNALPKHEVLTLVRLMETDDAADLLGDLTQEKSQEILAALGKEESDEVADLMGYPEDTAGGMMSTDFVALNQTMTVADAVTAIQNVEDSTIVFYLYVINDNDQLVGVISLKQLLLHKKSETLAEIMIPEVISVSVHEHREEAASKVERYDFLAVPVIDEQNKMVGVITVDDVIDVIREEAEEELLAMGQAAVTDDKSFGGHFRARLPWLSLAFVSGLLCFAIFYFFGIPEGSDKNVYWLLAAFIPLILTMTSTLGSQTASVTIGGIRSMSFRHGKLYEHCLQELKLSFLFSVIFVSLLFLLGLTMGQAWMSHTFYVLAGAFTLQMVLAALVGIAIPFLLERFDLNPTATAIPLFTVITNLSTIILLLSAVRLTLGFVVNE